MKMKLALTLILILCLAGAAPLVAAEKAKPAASDFKAPVISFASFEVPQYDDYWYYDGKVTPTKGKPADRGAPLPMSFVFNIYNPNPFPVLLEGITYTVSFDMEFDLITTNSQEAQWIPPGKTNQVRVTTMITVRSALTNLLLAGAPQLKAMGKTAWDMLEKWWKEVPNLTTIVTVKECTFTFSAKGVSKNIPFQHNIY
jgi:hypothetical protein